MRIHYARMRIKCVKPFDNGRHFDLYLKFVEGTRPQYMQLSLTKHCTETRLLAQFATDNLDDLQGQDIWIAMFSEPAEQPGSLGWEYIKPYVKGEQLDHIKMMFPVEVDKPWRLLQILTNRLPPEHQPKGPLH